MRKIATACNISILSACIVICAAGAAHAASDSGEIRQNLTLTKETWNSIDLPQANVPSGAPAPVLINIDVPVQLPPTVTEACTVLSQVVVDGTPVGLQTISVVPDHRTLSIREARQIRLAPGAHTVAAQLYPECEGATVMYTTWPGGVWGGNYSYLVMP